LERVRRFATGLSAVLAVLVLGGCGGSGADGGSQASGRGDPAAGSKLFAETGCGNCHTLQAAGSSGTVGPNLDERKPSFDQVVHQVQKGGIGMPSFEEKLSENEIEDVAAFVTGATEGGPVAADFKPDDTKLSDCGTDFACLEQAFGNLTYQRGPKPALEEFERSIRSNRSVEANCHRIAHMMGAAALTRYEDNVGRAFAEGDATCWSGYYHGVLERAFVGVDEDELPAASRKMCSDSQIRSVNFIYYQCVHGLGHGLMIYTGYDLPGSLKVCDRLATAWDQTSCTGGVFMENLNSSYGTKSRWLKDDDPLYPCPAVAPRHKLYCYLMVTSRILAVVGYDWKKTIQYCHRAEPAWVRICFQSLGRDASGQTRQHPRKILQICALAGTMERECVYGAARDITSNDAGGRRAARLCRNAAQHLRAYCFNGVGTILGGFSQYAEGRRAECVKVTKIYLRDCLRGAGVG
jgi:cytochrome c553